MLNRYMKDNSTNLSRCSEFVVRLIVDPVTDQKLEIVGQAQWKWTLLGHKQNISCMMQGDVYGSSLAVWFVNIEHFSRRPMNILHHKVFAAVH